MKNSYFFIESYSHVNLRCLRLSAFRKLLKILFFLCLFSGISFSAFSNPDTTCTITIPDTTAIPGDTILIPIKVRNFNDIGSIGFYISFDTASLKYLNLVNINSNVSGLYNEKDGVIMFSWIAFAYGISIGNCKILCMKFVYKGGNSAIGFNLSRCDLSDINTMMPKYVIYTNGGIYQCVQPYPVATVSYSGTTDFCQGDSLVLYATTNSDYKYNWFKDNQMIVGSTRSSFSAKASGSYQLQVTNSHKCNAISDNVAITVEPLPVIQSTTVIPICGSGTVSMNATASSGKIYWYTTPAGIVPTGSGGSYSTPVLNSSTTYYVEAVSKACTNTGRLSVIAQIYPLPSATVTPVGSPSVCVGNTVTLNANTGTSLSYKWQLNSVNITGGTKSTMTAANSGNYSVIVTDAHTCTNTSNAVSVSINPLPLAIITASGPISFCQGNSVTLNGNIGNNLKYQWKNSNSNIGGASNSLFNTGVSGNYSLIVTDANNCYNSSNSITVTSNPLPAATVTAGGPTTFCNGGTVKLSSNTATGYAYQWQKDGYFISGGTASSFNAALGGAYSVIITDNNNCDNTSTNTNVTVNNPPNPSVTAKSATSFCLGGNVTLAANTSTGLTYKWKKDNADIAGATSSSYVANASGNYSVYENNASNCPATSDATSVTVNPMPTSAITGPTTMCSGTSITLSAYNSSDYTYQWMRNSINISGATNYSYNPNGTGTYSAYISTSQKCSAASNTISVTFYAAPSANITPGGLTTFCQGSNVLLTSNTGTGYTYQWQNNNVNISNASTNAYTASAQGNYSVIISNNGCAKTSASVSVNVVSIPSANITPVGSATICQASPLTLNANTGSGLTYKWTKNGTNISNATNSQFSVLSALVTDAGNYAVIVSNGSCAQTSATTTVTVNALPTASISSPGLVTFCQGNALTINATSGTGYKYQWQKNGSNVLNATNSQFSVPSSLPADAGIYTAIVTNNSCSKTSNALTYTINPLPTSTLTPSGATTFCQGGNVVLSSSTGTGYVYKWYKDNTLITSALSSSYTTSVTGSIYVSVTDANSCSAKSSSLSVTVNPVPSASITPATATTLCQNNALTLNANTGSGLTYKWAKNGTLITNATNSQFSVLSSQIADAGAYTVVVSNGSCSQTSAVTTVTINALPIASLTPSGATTFCQGGNVVLSTASGTSYVYKWYKDNTLITSALNSSYSAGVTGSIYVSVTDVNSCSAKSASVSITVNPLPVVDLGADKQLKLNDALSLSAGSGFSSYQWYKNGSIIFGATRSAFSILNVALTDAGAYSVNVSNSYNCSSSDVLNVSVSGLTTYTISGNVTYDNANSTPLSNIRILLFNSVGSRIDSVLTNSSGHYTFSNLANGTYNVKANITKLLGGVDPRDALLVNKYFIGTATLKDNLIVKAADVNSDARVNAQDALLINRRYIGSVTSFKPGDWLFVPANVTVNNANAAMNFSSVCYGDADGSYNPPAKLMTDINLITYGELNISKQLITNNEQRTIKVPVKAGIDMNIGALGLIFDVQNPDFSIESLSSDIPDLIYNISNSDQLAINNYKRISIAWSALKDPLAVKAGQTIFYLEFNISDPELKYQSLELISLSPESVISDINSDNISNAVFTIPQITNHEQQITNNNSHLKQNFPNPFTGTTFVEYTIPDAATVQLSIYNLLGQKMTELLNKPQDKGTYTIMFNLATLQSGLYLYKLEAKDTATPFTEEKLMMLSK